MLADGELVATKSRGFLTSLLGGGWPDPDEVVAALHKKTIV